jgi:hypothetical protein
MTGRRLTAKSLTLAVMVGVLWFWGARCPAYLRRYQYTYTVRTDQKLPAIDALVGTRSSGIIAGVETDAEGGRAKRIASTYGILAIRAVIAGAWVVEAMFATALGGRREESPSNTLHETARGK